MILKGIIKSTVDLLKLKNYTLLLEIRKRTMIRNMYNAEQKIKHTIKLSKAQ